MNDWLSLKAPKSLLVSFNLFFSSPTWGECEVAVLSACVSPVMEKTENGLVSYLDCFYNTSIMSRKPILGAPHLGPRHPATYSSIAMGDRDASLALTTVGGHGYTLKGPRDGAIFSTQKVGINSLLATGHNRDLFWHENTWCFEVVTPPWTDPRDEEVTHESWFPVDIIKTVIFCSFGGWNFCSFTCKLFYME